MDMPIRNSGANVLQERCNGVHPSCSYTVRQHNRTWRQHTLAPRKQASRKFVPARRLDVSAAADTSLIPEGKEMVQIQGREQWYETKFVADDAPDWNPARWVSSRQVGPGLKEVVLEVEISRGKVPLRNGYVRVGQKAQIRVNSGQDHQLTVASPPFPLSLNRAALLRARNDMSAGETKVAQEVISVLAQLHLLVGEKEAPDVYKLSGDDILECGPFVGGGVDLAPMTPIFSYVTIVIFAEGPGIATARALIEAEPDVGGLSFRMRSDVRLYYRAQTDDGLCFKELYPEWEERFGCKVMTAARDSFQDLFDDDATLEYEPATTAAIILTGGDPEADKAARKVCAEAEISCITSDTKEKPLTVHASTGSLW